MRVMHTIIRTIDMPLERLRFRPDPLGLNPVGCDEPVIVAFDVEGEERERRRQEAQAEAQRREEANDPFAPPRWIKIVLTACAIVLAVLHSIVVGRWVLGRPRLRVVPKEGE